MQKDITCTHVIRENLCVPKVEISIQKLEYTPQMSLTMELSALTNHTEYIHSL